MFPILLASLAGLMAGGPWMWSGLVICLFLVVGGDAVFPEDLTLPVYRFPELLNLILFSTLPFVAALFMVLIWMFAPSGDPLYLARFVQWLIGWDLLAARSRTGMGNLIGGILTTVLMTGIAGINMAHELMHRSNLFMKLMGRLLQVFSYDIPGHIAHLNAHHVLVGTPEDPSTSRRGESSYAFVVRAIVSGNLFAWRVEEERMRSMNKQALSWKNRVVQGHMMSTLMAVGAYLMSGWKGALVFVVTAILSKALLELVNYIQHYGLIRIHGTPIAVRHSWNSNKRMSINLLCNVTRHSHHHIEPSLPFWRIEPAPESPTLRYGYLASLLIALVPPIWHRMMAPQLLYWDLYCASTEERKKAIGFNRRSGVPKLVASI
jgi:alkane 1-monooxygenase